jgi:hypothetical protein
MPSDISDAVLFLAPDESRYVTGLTMTADAGFVTRYGAQPDGRDAPACAHWRRDHEQREAVRGHRRGQAESGILTKRAAA